MPTYQLATVHPDGAAILELLAEVMKLYHPSLHEADVYVDVLFAFARKGESGEALEVPLKLHGYPCLATMKVRAAKERAQALGDALMTIDYEAFTARTKDEQSATLDHELSHLELKLNDEGEVKLDDYGRPKLGLRLHDRQFGWFDAVARRWKESSVEVEQATDLITLDGVKQLYFPGWFADEKGAA